MKLYLAIALLLLQTLICDISTSGKIFYILNIIIIFWAMYQEGMMGYDKN